jgi:phthalate 4,5-dioxygenase
VLHSGFIRRGDIKLRDLSLTLLDNAPDFQMDVTSYGLREGALRNIGDGRIYARIRQIVLPFFTFIPGAEGDLCSGRATVPVDDEWDAEWYIVYDPDRPISEDRLGNLYTGTSQDLMNFAANLGTTENLWFQDRDAMKTGHWSGLTRNVSFEDFVIQASMGPLVDGTKEQLGSADAILARTRRLLLDGINEYRRTGKVPWRSEDIDFSVIRALAVTIPREQDWRELSPDFAAHKAAAE